MSEILDTVQSFYDIAKWVYDQLITMKENRAEAQALAERVHRLSDVALALKTHLQPGLVQLSPEIRACLKHVEEYFMELDSMLSAHTGQSYPQGFRGKAKAAFAKAKEFFRAQNWKEQLMAADSTLTKVLGDLQTSMVAQNLTISVNTNQGVQRVEDAVNEIKDMMQAHSVGADGLSVYRPSQITDRIKIDKGGSSEIFQAHYPDSVDSIAYKKCNSLLLFSFGVCMLYDCDIF
jgi:hypothetical protein